MKIKNYFQRKDAKGGDILGPLRCRAFSYLLRW